MERSLFQKWLDKFNFQSVVKKIVEKINGEKSELVYLHKTMLKKEYSATLRWGSINTSKTRVAADVVAMDSSLPLKKRDSIRKAEGEIPKVGMKLYLNERTMNDLDILEATQGAEKEIFKKLFKDSERCIVGVHERNEMTFLQGLSTGVGLIPDEENPGIGVRVNYGHPDENKFGVSVKWSEEDAKPIDDIENVLSNADDNGDMPSYMLMDKTSWNALRSKSDVKELFAAHMGFTGANIPRPTLKQVNEMLGDNYGLTIMIIDRTVITEANGVRTKTKPWADNTVVFLTSLEVGSLTYGKLAEETHQAKHVTYAKADDYILVSKYHKNDPIREFTSSQAIVVPVIDNVDSIYIMKTDENIVIDDADNVDEGGSDSDTNITLWETVLDKQNVIDKMNEIFDFNTTSGISDNGLIDKINKLSNEDEQSLKDALEVE